MKRSLVIVILLLAPAISGRSQTSTPSPPAGHAQMHAQHQEHREAMCRQMMEGHLADLKATSQTLATNLAQLKATLPMISDINERSRWQSNIAMWQALADHFNYMAGHAENMQATGMGCGVMMGHDMGDHAAHERSTPPTPPSPQ